MLNAYELETDGDPDGSRADKWNNQIGVDCVQRKVTLVECLDQVVANKAMAVYLGKGQVIFK
ncbi:MAG: hypothetical protein V9E94_15490 [Microthrixaceae bacterium]